MPANHLYHTRSDQIWQLGPKARKTLIHNSTWLLIGIVMDQVDSFSVVSSS